MKRHVKVYVECGCCGRYHPQEWYGDCRDDAHRFSLDEILKNGKEDIEGKVKIIPLDEQKD